MIGDGVKPYRTRAGELNMQQAPSDAMTAMTARSSIAVLSRAMLAVFVAASAWPARAEDLNDYPTSARADYVFACMKANGETQDILQKCSCSIDVIASVIPYEAYVAAETIVSMSQVTGPVGAEFRSTEQAKLALQDFRRAQAEAEVRCF
jgi:poly-beta-hydroxyalkanoate depolymerase